MGLKVILQTHHKQILQTKPTDDLTPRLHMRIRLIRYDYTVAYVPGKKLTVVDALSRCQGVGNRKQEIC